MRPVVVIVILPLAQLFVHKLNVIRDAVRVQELIELLVVHAMRSLDLPVQVRRPRLDVDVADVVALHVPVEGRLKLRAIVP